MAANGETYSPQHHAKEGLMSTRATYLIDGQPFYIHYDGYVEGGAAYFAAAARLPNKRGGFVCQFLRANDLAEFTTAHDDHGDTEYQYTYDSAKDVLAVREASRDVCAGRFANERKWSPVFAGSLARFLNTYGSEGEVWAIFRSRVWHRDDLTAWATERLDYAVEAFGKGWTGIAGAAVSEVCKMGEAAVWCGVAGRALDVATKYYDEHLVTMGHPQDRAESSYWKEYLGGQLPALALA